MVLLLGAATVALPEGRLVVRLLPVPAALAAVLPGKGGCEAGVVELVVVVGVVEIVVVIVVTVLGRDGCATTDAVLVVSTGATGNVGRELPEFPEVGRLPKLNCAVGFSCRAQSNHNHKLMVNICERGLIVQDL